MVTAETSALDKVVSIVGLACVVGVTIAIVVGVIRSDRALQRAADELVSVAQKLHGVEPPPAHTEN